MSEIEYRLATPEEWLSFARLQNFVFSFVRDEKEIKEKIAGGGYKNEDVYVAIGEDGQVLAGMGVIPFTIWFDGQKVPMAGIGGVAGTPENRRKGNIRNIFAKVFRDINEKGVVFSHLYPFSYAYYQKFGYEHCGTAKRYTLRTACARKFKNNGTTCEFVNGDDVQSKLTDVYEAYASRQNAMISRSELRWKEVFDFPSFGDTRFYYWQNEKQEVKAWVKFKRDGHKLMIHDIAWSDSEGMFGILQFLGRFDGAAETFTFTSSPELIPEIYWDSIYEIETETAGLGMNRIVNVKRALELMKKPEGNGKFVIKVIDDFLEWNNATYTVEYSNGECSVETTECFAADIETNERALTQMVLGVYGFDNLALREDVSVYGNQDVLGKVFCKKNVFITDGF